MDLVVVVKVRELIELFGLSISLLVLVHLGLEFFHVLEVKTALVRDDRFDLREQAVDIFAGTKLVFHVSLNKFLGGSLLAVLEDKCVVRLNAEVGLGGL